MICVSLKAYTRACGGVTGGISDLAIFDPNDLNFTQGGDSGGSKVAYNAVSLRDDVEDSTPTVFMISFQTDEAEWTWTQSKTGCAVKYEHSFVFQLPENSQNLTTWQQAIDAAGCCCGIGIIVRLNSGKIFIAGEKYVNGVSIPRFTIAQDGSEGGSGKLYDDFNGGTITLTGSYSRNLYEYSGPWSDIEALAEQGSSAS